MTTANTDQPVCPTCGTRHTNWLAILYYFVLLNLYIAIDCGPSPYYLPVPLAILPWLLIRRQRLITGRWLRVEMLYSLILLGLLVLVKMALEVIYNIYFDVLGL